MRRIVCGIVGIVLLSGLTVVAVVGQRPMARIAQLEGDEHYRTLTERFDELSAREESVEERIEDIRKIFADDAPDKESYSEELINLEIELYRLRDTMDIIARDINVIEQDWTIRNLGNDATVDDTPAATSVQTPYLVANDFFRQALSPEDYRLLLQKQEAERETEQIMARIRSNYDSIEAVNSVYMTADKEHADSLFVVLSNLDAENEMSAARMRSIWDDAFNSKVYLYNYILDKAGKTAMMADMERLMVEVRLRIAETKGRYMYDAMAAYPFGKSLLLRYETGLASENGLTMAVDSLSKAAVAITALDRYLMPVINIEERLFLDYTDISVVKPSAYNSANPIPETEIYDKGLIYRILLGVYSKPQAAGLFKGVHPLSYEQKDDGRYYYYAGGFATLEEAEAAVGILKDLGFNAPHTVAWLNGEYLGADGANDAPVGQRQGARMEYRVEITGAVDGLSERVRTLIGEIAPGKEISKVVGRDGISALFIIASFDNDGAARAVATAITIY